MKIKIFLLLSVLVLFSTFAKSQTLKLGFRVEPTFLFMEENNSNTTRFTPFSLYLTSLIQPVDNLTFEFRPGILLASDEYIALQIGGYIRYNIWSKFFLMAGLISDSNTGYSHNGGGSYNNNILYKCIGVGFQSDSIFGFDISYYWTSDKEFGYDRVIDYSAGYSTNIPRKMNGILKLGFSLAWDIF